MYAILNIRRVFTTFKLPLLSSVVFLSGVGKCEKGKELRCLLWIKRRGGTETGREFAG
jgi:hypothetical protein